MFLRPLFHLAPGISPEASPSISSTRFPALQFLSVEQLVLESSGPDQLQEDRLEDSLAKHLFTYNQLPPAMHQQRLPLRFDRLVKRSSGLLRHQLITITTDACRFVLMTIHTQLNILRCFVHIIIHWPHLHAFPCSGAQGSEMTQGYLKVYISISIGLGLSKRVLKCWIRAARDMACMLNSGFFESFKLLLTFLHVLFCLLTWEQWRSTAMRRYHESTDLGLGTWDNTETT